MKKIKTLELNVHCIGWKMLSTNQITLFSVMRHAETLGLKLVIIVLRNSLKFCPSERTFNNTSSAAAIAGREGLADSRGGTSPVVPADGDVGTAATIRRADRDAAPRAARETARGGSRGP